MGPGSQVIYQSKRTLGTYRERPGVIVRVILETELRQESWGIELSLMGEEITTRGRWVSGGQIRDALQRIRNYAMPRAKVKKLAAIWDRWHLNGMRAGCEHQRALGWTSTDHLSQPCPECGYRYGTAWLHETLPDDVMSFVKEL